MPQLNKPLSPIFAKTKASLMCEEIHRQFPLESYVRSAMESIDREPFHSLSHKLYNLEALPIQNEQFISNPLTVAKMTQYLTRGDSVLEIGCGSGYQAMVLSKIFRRVFSIERIQTLLLEARIRIRNAHISNISTKLDDGQKGWAEYAPYDRILFSACINAKNGHSASIPTPIIEQLEDGGIIVAPMQEGNKQFIKRFTKTNNRLSEPEILEQCSFVPIVSGITK